MRIINHPILGDLDSKNEVTIYLDGKPLKALENETITSALLANGIKVFRYTQKRHEPRSVFCCIGRCNDCLMTVDGIPNVCTCTTPVRDGMQISTQMGKGSWCGLNEKG